MVPIKFKVWKLIHVLLWFIWAIVTVAFYSQKTDDTFNLLFGKYFSYNFFYWFELIFMFGGGLLLMVLLSKLLPVKLIYLSYVLFEMLFISIIVIKLMIVFY